MEIVILPDEAEIGQRGADVVERLVRTSPRPVLGLATGSSPLPVYRELIARHRAGLPFEHVRAFLLDEYAGLPADHPQSYARTIRRDLTEHLDMPDDAVRSPDGAASDIPAAAAAYEAAIAAAGGVDVQILGIGSNGHIAFNEPGSALTSRTRIVTLTDQTRADNARFFDSVDDVPQWAVSQGLGTISDARHLLVVATGEGKAEAVAAMAEGPLTASCPASVLQLHPHVTVLLDEAAASGLEGADRYREVFAHKPGWQGL